MAHLEYTKRCVIKLLYLISNEKMDKGKVIIIPFLKIRLKNEKQK